MDHIHPSFHSHLAVMARAHQDRNPISLQEAKAILWAAGGADVFSMYHSDALRKLWRQRPDLVVITDPLRSYKPRDVHPYFGTIPTRLGIMVAFLVVAEQSTADDLDLKDVRQVYDPARIADQTGA